MMRGLIKDELVEIREKYADPRQTQIVESTKTKALTATDLLPDENVWVLVGEKGTLARSTSSEMINIPLKPDEQPAALLQANTQDVLYLFAADGRAASLPVYQLPQAREMGKGTHWAELTGFTRRNHLAAAQVVPADAGGYIFLTTLAGIVKRVRLEDLPGISSDPFIVMNVGDDDALGWARLTTGDDEVLLVTANGQAIRFTEEQVRAMGLPAGGVYGIKLAGDTDGLIAMDLIEDDGYLWSITDNGMAKATALQEYPSQGRHGQGVINMRLPKGAGEVAAAVVAQKDTELLITTGIGSTKKAKVGKGKLGSRSIKPEAVFKVGGRNRITGVVRMTERPSTADDPSTKPRSSYHCSMEKRKRRRKNKNSL
jgi:DNA gyrase subunit A